MHIKMSIRWKIFCIMLVFSLLPLFLVRTVSVKAGKKVFDNITGQLSESLVEIVSNDLESTAVNAGETLQHSGSSLSISVMFLAQTAQRALATGDTQPHTFMAANNFPGISQDNATLEESIYHSAVIRNGDLKPLQVNWESPSVYLPAASTMPHMGQSKEPRQDKTLINRMKDITPELQRMFGATGTVLWLRIVMKDGTEVAYPGHGRYPRNYDPRDRESFTQSRWSDGPTWSMPNVDPSTRRSIGTIAAPFYDKNNEFAGVAAIDFLVSDMLQATKLISEWSDQITPMLVIKEKKEDTNEPGLRILAKQDYATSGSRNWMMNPQQEWLSAENKDDFRKFVQAVHNKDSGTMRMTYLGEESLWAFASLREVAFILIVPERVVLYLPDMVESGFVNMVDSMRDISGYTGLFVVVLVGIFAWFWARASTRPLLAMSSMARELGEGNFDVYLEANTGDERDDLINTFNEVGPKLKERLKIRKELEVAQSVQEMLIPKEVISMPGFDIAGGIKYCDATGGDYYDFLNVEGVDGSAFAVVVGDVSGHGLPAALLMTTARALLQGLSGAKLPLERRISLVNKNLSRDLDQTGRFMTMFYLQLRPNENTLRWVSAGHDPAWCYSPHTDSFNLLDGPGLPLGVEKDWLYESRKGEMCPGGILLLATDGVWECRDSEGQMFGKERMLAIIRENRDKNAHDIMKAVFDAVADFTNGVVEDDVTVVIVKRSENNLQDR